MALGITPRAIIAISFLQEASGGCTSKAIPQKLAFHVRFFSYCSQPKYCAAVQNRFAFLPIGHQHSQKTVKML